MSLATTRLKCACGQFQLDVIGEPIINAECHCTSCREAGARLASVPPAFPLREPNGGTHYVLYRKDRVRFPDGTDNLAQFHLTPTSPTRRVLTKCCNTPVFTEFSSGHWLSLYAGLWAGRPLAPLDLRTQTGNVPPDVQLTNDVPAGAMATAGFYARLLVAWLAMGFKVPAIEITGDIKA
ncbi:hypothetical protein [Devosia sp. 2618]|uniref:GFA family protein n=1 Tax=Devosia sp. 2618 TaxID=3156454 RepID=UPI003395863B